MAEAPRPAVAGISQPDAGTLSSKLELVGFVSSVHGSAALHHHTNPQLLLLLSRALPSSAVAGTAVAGAPSLGCYLPELARRDLACMPYLPERGRRGRSNPTGAVACLGRKSCRSSRQSPVSQSQRRHSSRVDPCTVPQNRNFPKMEISQSGNHV